jgi:RHS repeat-associated protein
MSCVNVTLGLLNLEETDFSFPGFIPLALCRSYRSNSMFAGMFGFGWGSTLGEEIFTEGNEVILRNGEGRSVRFLMPSINQPVGNLVEGLELSLEGILEKGKKAAVFRIREGKRIRYYRDVEANGKYKLWRTEDLHGNAVQFSYRSGLVAEITDTLERKFAFQYDGSKRVTDILLEGSGSLEKAISLVRYKYDGQNDLIRAKKYTGAINEYEYQNHLLVRARDDQGVDYYNQYDQEGRCIKTWRGHGYFTRSYFFDTKRQQTKVVDSMGAVRFYRYNDFNLVTKTIDPLGGVSLFTYDESNKIALAVNQVGSATLLAYDEKKRQIAKTKAGGSTEEFVYDAEGRLAKHVNPQGGVSTATYNHLGDLAAAKSPTGNQTQYEYDERGGTKAILFGNGWRVRREYGRDYIRWIDDLGLILAQKFDFFGRCTEFSYPRGYKIEYQYDGFGRLIKERGIGGGIREFVYNNRGQLARFINERGAVTTYEYNEVGLRTVTTSEGKRVQFVNDTEGRLIQLINSKGELHTIRYDPKGRMIQQTFFDGREEFYEHDPAGALTKIKDGLDREIHYENDVLGRPVTVRCSDGTRMEFAYTPTGKIALATRDEFEVQFKYDLEDRVVYQRQGAFELLYTYDPQGNCLEVKDANGKGFGFEWDPRMRVKRLTIDMAGIPANTPESLELSLEYDELDSLIRMQSSAGVTLQRENNGWNRPVRQRAEIRGSTILEEEYAYDTGAQLIERLRQDGEHRTFAYNKLGQLVSVQINDEESEGYAYDGEFNLLAKTIGRGAGSTTSTFEYASGNRLVRAGHTEYRYNAAGLLVEVIRGGQSTHYFYSCDDLITRVEHPDGSITEYAYDAMRRRILKKRGNQETRFLWDIQTLWREETVETFSDKPPEPWQTRDYVYDPVQWGLLAFIDNSKPYLACNDSIGTPQSLIDFQGKIVWELDMTAWGEEFRLTEKRQGALTCPPRFPGQYADLETSLFYNMNRYYDPGTGRYTSPDPVGLVGGINVYTYALNPINYIDPLGLECQNFKPGEPSTLFRGDKRDPSDICANGFKPVNPNAIISIKDHVGGDTRSWVSTSYDKETAKRFSDEKYVYIIENPGCGVETDCDPGVQEAEKELKEKHGLESESEYEFAFKNISPKSVKGYMEFTPSGWTKKSC